MLLGLFYFQLFVRILVQPRFGLIAASGLFGALKANMLSQCIMGQCTVTSQVVAHRCATRNS